MWGSATAAAAIGRLASVSPMVNAPNSLGPNTRMMTADAANPTARTKTLPSKSETKPLSSSDITSAPHGCGPTLRWPQPRDCEALHTLNVTRVTAHLHEALLINCVGSGA